MGILDQLFDILDSNTRDPAIAPVDTQLSQDDWVVATTSMAIHQGLRHGFQSSTLNDLIDRKIVASDVGANSVSNVLSRPEFGTTGTINVGRTFSMIDSWEKIVVSQQLQDIRYRPTADDFVDGGIKRGSKIVIEVVSESDTYDMAPYTMLKSAIKKTKGGKPVSLVFDKFSVVSFTEPDEARFQIHETFGADIIQSFGRRPRIMMISGNVLNGKARAKIGGEIRSMDWKNAFQRFYEDYASLHRNILVRDKVRIYAQDTVYDGYLLNMMSNTSVETQSLSQVTISFVISKKYSPKSNDEAIPGFTTDTGFRLAAAATPEEIFPDVELDHHFAETPEKLIAVAQQQTQRDLEKIVDAIFIFDNELDEVTLANNYTGYIFDTPDSPYFSPAEKFRLHKVLAGGAIEKSVRYHTEQIRLLNSDIVAANTATGGLVSSGESGLSANILSNASGASDLRQRQGILRNAQRGLEETVGQANEFAVKYAELSDYDNHLSNLLEN